MRRNSLFLIFILSLSLSLTQLFTRELWFDEKASLLVSQKKLPELLETTARDTHPPLYFLILKAWSGFSENHFYLRSLSLIFGLVSLLIMWRLTQRLQSEKIAKIASLLLAISPLHVYYSTEIRMYSLFLLITLLFIYLFLIFTRQRSLKYLLFIIVVELLSLLTHYYAILLIVAVSLWLMSKKKQLLFRWIFLQVVVLLLWLPWLMYAMRFSKPDCWCFQPLIGLAALFSALAIGGVGLVTLRDLFFWGPLPLLLLSGITSGLLFIFFLKGVTVGSSAVSPLRYFFFLPLVVASGVGFFTPFFSPRAFIFLLPFYLMFVSAGIETSKRFYKQIVLLIITLLSLTTLLQGTHPFFTQIPSSKRDLKIEQLKFLNP